MPNMLPNAFPAPIVEQVDWPELRPFGIKLSVVRDDLLDAEIIGNKWRKLMPHLPLFQQSGHDVIATMGGAYSNHILATSFVTKRFGIKTIGLVRGEELNPHSNAILRQCHDNGMALHFVSRDDYRQFRDDSNMVQDHLDTLHHNGVYFIAEGGYSKAAMLGCAAIITKATTKADHIFCACGTGTMAAGLAYAVMEMRDSGQPYPQLHGVCALPIKQAIKDNITLLLGHLPDFIRLHTPFGHRHFGKPAPQLIPLMQDFHKNCAIMLDYNYTAKMMHQILAMAQSGEIASNSRIIAVHSGGTQTAALPR